MRGSNEREIQCRKGKTEQRECRKDNSLVERWRGGGAEEEEEEEEEEPPSELQLLLPIRL